MTTPPGQEPRPGARRGGPARSRREADPGWADDVAGSPHFTPAGAGESAGGGGAAGGRRPPRDPDRRYGGRDGADPGGAQFTPRGAGFRDRGGGPDPAPSFRPRENPPRGGSGGSGGPGDGGSGPRGPRGPRGPGGPGGPGDRDRRGAPSAAAGTAFEDPWSANRGGRGDRGDRGDRGRQGDRGRPADRDPRGERDWRGQRDPRGVRDPWGERNGRGERTGRNDRAPEFQRSGPALLRQLGRPGVALSIFFGAAIIGAIGTIATHADPGFVLGFMIIIGACIAALCIRRRAVYVLIPLPALTYLVLAVVTGYAHDHSMGTSTTTLATDFTQWLSGGFTGICLATILVLLIFGGRLLLSRQLVSGQFQTSARRPPNGRFPRAPMAPPTRAERSPRRERAPWDDPDTWNDRAARGDDHRGDNHRGDDHRGDDRGGNPRGDRDSRGDRDARRLRNEPRNDPRGDRREERDAWYEQPRAGRSRPADGRPADGRPSDNDQQRTQALPPTRQQPPGRRPAPDAPPGRGPRRPPNDDRWRG